MNELTYGIRISNRWRKPENEAISMPSAEVCRWYWPWLTRDRLDMIWWRSWLGNTLCICWPTLPHPAAVTLLNTSPQPHFLIVRTHTLIIMNGFYTNYHLYRLLNMWVFVLNIWLIVVLKDTPTYLINE